MVGNSISSTDGSLLLGNALGVALREKIVEALEGTWLDITDEVGLIDGVYE